jgi:ABC-type transport system involved in multi-copper enzyme maturation permease subunit
MKIIFLFLKHTSKLILRSPLYYLSVILIGFMDFFMLMKGFNTININKAIFLNIFYGILGSHSIIFITIFASEIFLVEKRNGIDSFLLSMPVKLFEILIGKVLGLSLISFLSSIIVFYIVSLFKIPLVNIFNFDILIAILVTYLISFFYSLIIGMSICVSKNPTMVYVVFFFLLSFLMNFFKIDKNYSQDLYFLHINNIYKIIILFVVSLIIYKLLFNKKRFLES